MMHWRKKQRWRWVKGEVTYIYINTVGEEMQEEQ